MASLLAYGLLAGVSAMTLSGRAQPKDLHKDFHLFFNTAGLGSGMGTIQPTFKVEGDRFNFTLDQNSHYGTRTLASQDVCAGTLRATAIDSIIALAKSVGDTSIYRTDPSIMSGSISELEVRNGTLHVRFTLHNDSHPIANRIIAILNSNIPADKQKLRVTDPE